MAGKKYLPTNVLAYQKMVHNIRAKVALNQDKWDIASATISVFIC
jgi:hypothetical protein